MHHITYGSVLADTIKEIRARNGLSVRDLSRITGLPRTTLRRRLADGNLSIPELTVVADALGITAKSLMDLADARSAA